MLIRRVVACLLVVLLAAPAWSTPTKVVGVVSSGEGASVSGGPLTQGTTLFSGDIVAVGPKGSALLALGSDSARVLVGASSNMQLHREDDRVAFELIKGQAAFRLNSKAAEATLYDLTITTENDATGIIKWNSENEVVIGAETGTLKVTSTTSGKSVTLRKGEATKATLSQGVAPEEQKRKLRRRGVLILSGVIIAIATIVGLVVSANESGLRVPPGKVVSPFIP